MATMAAKTRQYDLTMSQGSWIAHAGGGGKNVTLVKENMEVKIAVRDGEHAGQKATAPTYDVMLADMGADGVDRYALLTLKHMRGPGGARLEHEVPELAPATMHFAPEGVEPQAGTVFSPNLINIDDRERGTVASFCNILMMARIVPQAALGPERLEILVGNEIVSTFDEGMRLSTYKQHKEFHYSTLPALRGVPRGVRLESLEDKGTTWKVTSELDRKPFNAIGEQEGYDYVGIYALRDGSGNRAAAIVRSYMSAEGIWRFERIGMAQRPTQLMNEFPDYARLLRFPQPRVDYIG